MDLQTKKLNFIREILAVSNEEIIDEMESILKKERQNLDPILKKKLTSRALKANENIREGKVYSRKEAEAKLKERIGI
ncbi:MAG: hypothetical protein KAQ62_19145 [Cyclobacteriaceae bacterium]|nr:hypothetical protein [Cyclobacteriaceae bacterium]MCK5210459.1 hypothetical protein [Cyclobacteriaceae bacterium]MCK5281579.1 hypothetical protein [Cyclobacteriaceae bacterium]MCK5370692.1 hypothetical protein [Cyclobacteriaceae bacterium]MCK5470735.1 hypothetical protein [Cyclobacteriaceae bacterium]